jgi:hypothetical protein
MGMVRMRVTSFFLDDCKMAELVSLLLLVIVNSVLDLRITTFQCIFHCSCVDINFYSLI